MPRIHLTDEERSIRRSRGIAIWRIFPFLLPIIAIIIMSADDQLFVRCIGHPMPVGGRMAAVGRILVAIPCTPYFVSDFSEHWWVIAIFCIGVALAVPQYIWMKHHTVYWNSVRANERLKRAQKSQSTDSKNE